MSFKFEIIEETTESALAECGDVMGEMYHPAFRELAILSSIKPLPYIRPQEELVSYAVRH